MSHCCKRTAEYLEGRYENYIKLCPIVGGNCICHFQERRIDRITRSKMSDPVSWAKPMITCSHKFKINLYKVEPNVKSPQPFPAGLNNIKYNFILYGGKTVSCAILVYVRSCNSSGKEEIAKRNGNIRDCKKDILNF
ncbi:uncharacterized protein LOC114539535 [Dendronephthya gigantea]|uniref:uncharacterized protein LOC114539535 n=1 Tax=Dendronephthya gigantea TaxID=151771 RepID=UPI00106AD0D2|nr:uncharacterized protein LOC114539535 [Dendronephthya gigantea]